MPSLTQSSLPAAPSSAVKKHAVAHAPSATPACESAAAGIDVAHHARPASLPSLTHSSSPCVAVVGGEEERAADIGEESGQAPSAPGAMSRTSCVPSSLPSLTHSSAPCSPSSALK